MKKKHIVLISVAAVLLAGILWLIWGNVTVGLTTITVTEENLPSSFDGYRIAHVSDLHNSWLWKQTIERLKEAKPDIICITGDMIDCRKTNVETALCFASEAVKVAPCYYITGNHEINVSREIREEWLIGLKNAGVTVLNDEEVILERNGSQIALVGHKWGKGDYVGELSDFVGYRILLSHRPECFADYVAGQYDLVLTGHAHGGQVRLPIIGGLFAPGQGVLPNYDSGMFTEGRTNMVVSRGVGNSAFPIRFNNRPEVILLILECQ